MWRDELKRIKECPQRHDSLNAQLFDLIRFADKLGFYDASDYLSDVLIFGSGHKKVKPLPTLSEKHRR